jgi:hypothetical protein
MSLNPAVQVMLSGGLSLGVPLMIAIYELRSLRRYRGGDEGWPRPAPDPKPSPTRDGSRPLPACLIPTEQWRAPVRVKELA